MSDLATLQFEVVRGIAGALGGIEEAMARLGRQLGALCGRLDAADTQRATCQALLKPAAKPAA